MPIRRSRNSGSCRRSAGRERFASIAISTSLSATNAERLLQTMTEDTTSHSRDALRPRFAGNFPPSDIRGRRECRMRAAPAISCAIVQQECAHEHTGQRRTSDIPCAMALRLISCSPQSGRARCHCRSSEALASSELDASKRSVRTTRLHRTLKLRSSLAALASTASPSLVVTMANAPLAGRDGQRYALIFSSDKAKYFLFRGLT